MLDPKEDISNNEIPRTVLLKVCKQVLPPSAAMSNEAKEALLKATTVFINYLTATALENSESKNKITEENVYRALEILELDSSILGPVKEAVNLHVQSRKEKYKKKKEVGMNAGENNGTEQEQDNTEMDN